MCWHGLWWAKQTVAGSQKERDCRVNLSSSDAGRPQSSFREGHIVLPNQVCIKLNNAVAWNWKPKSKSTPKPVLQDKAIKTLSLFFLSLVLPVSWAVGLYSYVFVCNSPVLFLPPVRMMVLLVVHWDHLFLEGPEALWSREAVLLLGQGHSARGPPPARGCKAGILVVLSPWVLYR